MRLETASVVALGADGGAETLEGLFEVQPANASRKASRIEISRMYRLFIATSSLSSFCKNMARRLLVS